MSIDHVFFAWLVYAACPPFVFEMTSRPAPSAALVAANQRLHNMRARIQAPSHSSEQCPVNSEPFATRCLPIVDLPEHLGWHSEAVSRVIRAKQVQQSGQQKPPPPIFPKKPSDFPLIQSETARSEALSLDFSQSVTVYPDIALAMLRQEQAAAGRLWLLLRHLDVDGRGGVKGTFVCVCLRACVSTMGWGGSGAAYGVDSVGGKEWAGWRGNRSNNRIQPW